jgi:hypothetical protein
MMGCFLRVAWLALLIVIGYLLIRIVDVKRSSSGPVFSDIRAETGGAGGPRRPAGEF